MTTTVANTPVVNTPPRLDPHGNVITREKAEQILHRNLLPSWRQSAGTTVQRIIEQANLQQDYVAKSNAIGWGLGPDGKLRMQVGDVSLRVHSNALQQAGGLTDIPAAYMETLMRDEPQLLVENLVRRFKHRGTNTQLIRAVGDSGHAILSTNYKRINSAPVVENLAKLAQKMGLVPMGGVASDLRFSLRMCLPEVYEIMPGEFIMFGLNWMNSDFGKGAHGISAFILRVICNNGAVVESALRQIHLGAKITEDDVMSQRTIDLHTATAVSATEDVVRAYLDPGKIEEKLTAVRMSAEKDITPLKVEEFLKKHLTKDAVRKAKETYLSADVTMIPAGQTAWRLSNTLSWLANQETDSEVALDFQALAGKALTLAA